MKYLEFNGNNKTIAEWAKITGLSYDNIAKRIYKFGWSIEDALTKPLKSTYGEKRKIILTQHTVDDIIDYHVNKHKTPSEIARKFNYNTEFIRRRLIEWGVYQFIGSRKYFFDENYFANIDTPRKAYWLGFFYADAWVSNNNVFSLEIKKEDRYILEMLASDVAYDGDIKDNENIRSINGGQIKPYPSSSITLCSKTLIKHLNNKGIIPNKTFRLSLPDINKNLYNHFVRGLFDGDGCVCKFKRKNNENRVQFSYNIVGQYKFLEEVSNLITEELSIFPNKIYRKSNEKCCTLSYQASYNENTHRLRENSRITDILKIKKWMYDDACIYLKRKKYIFDLIKTPPVLPGWLF